MSLLAGKDGGLPLPTSSLSSLLGLVLVSHGGLLPVSISCRPNPLNVYITPPSPSHLFPSIQTISVSVSPSKAVQFLHPLPWHLSAVLCSSFPASLDLLISIISTNDQLFLATDTQCFWNPTSGLIVSQFSVCPLSNQWSKIAMTALMRTLN